ncbi:hypothetical protein HOY80DRAFT_1134579 [Tuber brumale]|nr:hypothetical protein HOY80DRAFT_1134579 [Tuber brumale]
MTTAGKVAQCIANFPRASLSPARTLQTGLTLQLHRRFVSRSRKDREAVENVDLESKSIYTRNFGNKIGLNPPEVGNSLTTCVRKKTTIIDAGSRPMFLDIQATTPTAPRVRDRIFPPHTGLYGNPDSCTDRYGWERTQAIGVACQQSAKIMGGRADEIAKPGRKCGVFLCAHSVQSVGNIPVDLSIWNDDLTSISGPKIYGPKDIRARNTHRRSQVTIVPLVAGSSQACGLRRGTHAHSLEFAFGERCGIGQEEIEDMRTSHAFSSPISSCLSTVRENYIRTIHHNKQSKQFTRTFRTLSHHTGDTEMRKRKATTQDSKVEIRQADLTEDQNTKAIKNTDKNKSNLKRPRAYSTMTISEAEKRLGLRLNIRGIPVKRMLEGKRALLPPDTILELKRRIYQYLVTYMAVRGYPIEATADSTKATINDIVFFTISPIIAQFIDETKQNLRLVREKEITSTDSGTSGMEEFVVMDRISYDQEKYVLAVEAKDTSLGEAIKHCFLGLQDMRDYNGGGTVYGFVSQGDSWRMISFDGTFTVSKKIELLFDDMDENEEEWMADYSRLVECFNVALSNGGKDSVEVV